MKNPGMKQPGSGGMPPLLPNTGKLGELFPAMLLPGINFVDDEDEEHHTPP